MASSTHSSQPKQSKAASLSTEEISKLFSLPIAEAASILGVCTNVLKRVCRSKGIVRWPYRKLAAGKNADDASTGAEKEKTELSKTGKQKPESSSNLPASVSTATGNRIVTGGAQSLTQTSLMKNIPTYMDDFKYGFPSTGLSSEPRKWWGSSGNQAESTTVKDDGQEFVELRNETSRDMTEDEMDWGTEDSGIENEPSAVLCSLRRKAVDERRELFKREASQELYRLSKKQKLVLMQVFGSSLRDQWKLELS